MTESALSGEADHLYRPLASVDEWAGIHVDGSAFAAAVARVEAVRGEVGEVGEMVRRDVLLAAARRSAGLASLEGPAHVRSNYEALLAARHHDRPSEGVIRRVHEVACRPQPTHRVAVNGRVQDHVLAAGDYKHHPNHLRLPSGEWLARAPVALVRSEMACLVESTAATPDLPARAQYLLQALVHVAPFEDGNGRAARALAGGLVLQVAPIPPLFSATGGVTEGFLAAVEAFEAGCTDPGPAALARWRAESEAADRLRSALVPAAQRALERYTARPQGARRADLSGATVEPGAIRSPAGVEETLDVDAHPLDGGPVVVRAREAGLALEEGAPLDPWLDRVVAILALRVAAELEDEEIPSQPR